MSFKYIISVAVSFVVVQIYVLSGALTINYKGITDVDANDIIKKVMESFQDTDTNEIGSLPVQNPLSLNLTKSQSSSEQNWIQFENVGEFTKACSGSVNKGSTETAVNCTLTKNVKVILPDIALPEWNQETESMNTIMEAKPHSVPYQVLIESVSLDDETKLCGGTLISKKFVLSLWKCILSDTNITVTLGAHDLKEEETTRMQRKGIVSLGLKKNGMKVVLIELSPEASLNDNVGIAKLPRRADVTKTYAGKEVNLCGWGPNRVLTYVEGTILKNSECKQFYPNLADSVACWSPKVQKNFCYSAPGSHVMYNGKMIGLMIRENQICLFGKPVRLVRITSILDWIEKDSDVTIE